MTVLSVPFAQKFIKREIDSKMSKSHSNIVDHVVDQNDDENSRRSNEFQAFRPKNALSQTSSDIIYARKERDKSPFMRNRISQRSLSVGKSGSQPMRSDSSPEPLRRSSSAGKVAGLSVHLQLDQERFALINTHKQVHT